MSLELDKAIESLEVELQNISLRAMEIRKTINQLLFLNGQGPKYQDIEGETGSVTTEVQARQFVGKDMTTAVKEIMRMRGKKPATSQEILDDLTKGDFEFPKDWKPKLRWKNLGISLGSNKEDFVWFKTSAGKVYALAEQYPDRKKELQKLGRKNATAEEPQEEDRKTE